MWRSTFNQKALFWRLKLPSASYLSDLFLGASKIEAKVVIHSTRDDLKTIRFLKYTPYFFVNLNELYFWVVYVLFLQGCFSWTKNKLIKAAVLLKYI